MKLFGLNATMEQSMKANGLLWCRHMLRIEDGHVLFSLFGPHILRHKRSSFTFRLLRLHVFLAEEGYWTLVLKVRT